MVVRENFVDLLVEEILLGEVKTEGAGRSASRSMRQLSHDNRPAAELRQVMPGDQTRVASGL